MLVAALHGLGTVAPKLAITSALFGREDLGLSQVCFEVCVAHLSLQCADFVDDVAQALASDCLGGEQSVEFSLLFDKRAAQRTGLRGHGAKSASVRARCSGVSFSWVASSSTCAGPAKPLSSAALAKPIPLPESRPLTSSGESALISRASCAAYGEAANAAQAAIARPSMDAKSRSFMFAF
jgi:hypothetical protein